MIVCLVYEETLQTAMDRVREQLIVTHKLNFSYSTWHFTSQRQVDYAILPVSCRNEFMYFISFSLHKCEDCIALIRPWLLADGYWLEILSAVLKVQIAIFNRHHMGEGISPILDVLLLRSGTDLISLRILLFLLLFLLGRLFKKA